MTSGEIFELYDEYVAPTYGRFPLVIVSGQGARCKDPEGREYVDFTSGIGVNSLGFCDKGWADAVARQASTLNHTSNLYYTVPGGRLAELLCKNAGMEKAFFANSGAESNEGAIKVARKYSHDRYGEGRATVLTLVNSFHGRTVTTLAATGQEVFHKNFMPFTEGFRYVEANNPAALRKAMTGDVCAILMEMVQGEGGVIPLDPEFVQTAAELCAEKDVLLMVDEVQTGIGRTGTLFAFQQYGIEPDVVTFAKGVGGGLPLGGFLLGKKTALVLGKGDHATTFGANPIACAGGCEVLERLTSPGFLEGVAEKGRYFREKLLAMPHVSAVDGLGLMMGVVTDLPAADVVRAGIEKGVLMLTAKTKVRLLPPLTITKEEIDEGLARMEAALAAL